MKITKKQFCEVLDFLNKFTDGDISHNENQDNSITFYYRDEFGDFCYDTIGIDKDNFIEDFRVTELKKDILDAEERLADLRKELAELTQE